MKNVFKNSLIFSITFIIASTLQSCEQKSEHSDETLKGFMLAGPYIVNNYGGMAEMKIIMGLSDNPSEEKMINAYKKAWVFFLDKSYKSDCSSALVYHWDINDKTSLIEVLDILKEEPDGYKAWDYASLVNNAVLGYCAGYITKEEVNNYLTETLKLAQEQFPDWKSYFDDYNKGCFEWNDDEVDVMKYSDIVYSMQGDLTSIYKLLPLK